MLHGDTFVFFYRQPSGWIIIIYWSWFLLYILYFWIFYQIQVCMSMWTYVYFLSTNPFSMFLFLSQYPADFTIISVVHFSLGMVMLSAFLLLFKIFLFLQSLLFSCFFFVYFHMKLKIFLVLWRMVWDLHGDFIESLNCFS